MWESVEFEWSSSVGEKVALRHPHPEWALCIQSNTPVLLLPQWSRCIACPMVWRDGTLFCVSYLILLSSSATVNAVIKANIATMSMTWSRSKRITKKRTSIQNSKFLLEYHHLEGGTKSLSRDNVRSTSPWPWLPEVVLPSSWRLPQPCTWLISLCTSWSSGRLFFMHGLSGPTFRVAALANRN